MLGLQSTKHNHHKEKQENTSRNNDLGLWAKTSFYPCFFKTHLDVIIMHVHFVGPCYYSMQICAEAI